MFKKATMIIMACLMVCVLIAPLSSAKEMKVGYVDLRRAFYEYGKTQELETELNTATDESQAKRTKKIEEITLLLDTSTETLTLAIFKENRIIYDLQKNHIREHLQNLVPEIQNGLKKAGIDIKDITNIVTGTGPGSFTGIRIGVTTAINLAMAGDIKIAGVSTLKIISSAFL